MMDREERSAEHPAQDESLIALKLIATYAQFGLIPMVIPPIVDRSADPDRADAGPAGHRPRVPPQAGGAPRLRLLRHAGPAPFTNTAYWGPPIRVGLPQRAITVNMGPETNAKLERGEEGRPRAGARRGQGPGPARRTRRCRCRRSRAARPPLAALPVAARRHAERPQGAVPGVGREHDAGVRPRAGPNGGDPGRGEARGRARRGQLRRPAAGARASSASAAPATPTTASTTSRRSSTRSRAGSTRSASS